MKWIYYWLTGGVGGREYSMNYRGSINREQIYWPGGDVFSFSIVLFDIRDAAKRSVVWFTRGTNPVDIWFGSSPTPSENFYSLSVVFGDDNPMLTRKRILLLLSDWGWGGREYSMNYRGSINWNKLTRSVKIFVLLYSRYANKCVVNDWVRLFCGYMIWLLPHPPSRWYKFHQRHIINNKGELNDGNRQKLGSSIHHSIFSGSLIFFPWCFFIWESKTVIWFWSPPQPPFFCCILDRVRVDIWFWLLPHPLSPIYVPETHY